jgi:hypothetical protein
MKRHTDVPGPDAGARKRKTGDVPAHTQHTASRDEHPTPSGDDGGVTTRLRALRNRAEPASPVEAAAALIELALQESAGPVEDLGSALTRMALLIQPKPGDGASGDPELREQIAREISVCIESVQFHDRLTQQLTQVRNLLATLAFSDIRTDIAGRPLEGDPHNWLVLLENLRARFTSDSHRILFNLLLPGTGGRTSVPALHANEGSVELF